MEGDILDFANYVFSYAHEPHDFKKMIPKVYEEEGFAPLHHLVMDEGRIVGMAALFKTQWKQKGHEPLQIGIIGQVACHPYRGGEGIMRLAMEAALKEAEDENLDLLILGGDRARYGYYGFERVGTVIHHKMSASTLKHRLKEVDENTVTFLAMEGANPELIDSAFGYYQKLGSVMHREREDFVATLKNFFCTPTLVMKGEKVVGYFVQRNKTGDWEEWSMDEDALFPAVKRHLKNCLKEYGDGFFILIPIWRLNACKNLQKISAGFRILPAKMIRILNWQRTLSFMLHLKAQTCPLPAGKAALSIENIGAFELAYNGKEASVTKTTDSTAPVYTEIEAHHLLFTLPGSMVAPPELSPFLPLPAEISSPDYF
jgi:predicted N-acetyltransferase YhbS